MRETNVFSKCLALFLSISVLLFLMWKSDLSIADQSSTITLFVPVVLSTPGLNGSYFTSELTLTNRGSSDAKIDFTYTAAQGGGGGQATTTLASGHQIIASDTITYLKNLGIPIADSGSKIGTLRIVFNGLSSPGDGMATVRTTTPVNEGRVGLAYTAIPTNAAMMGVAYLCGLRQDLSNRSNVAIQNVGSSSQGPVTLRLTVYSGDPSSPSSLILPDETLPPGGFKQINGILASNGLSLTNGFVRIERISGSAPYNAYAVVNDQSNSDGSYINPIIQTDSPIAGLILPVIVGSSLFSSELILTNFSSKPRTIRLRYVADSIQAENKTAQIALNLNPNEQKIIPNFIEYLREKGVPGISLGVPYAGALFATVDGGDASGIALGALTYSLGGGGRYGLFYNAVPQSQTIPMVAWLNGLQQNSQNRSNIALVNVGDRDENADVFTLEVFDGATGIKAATIQNVTIPARGWLQMSSFLRQYAPQTTQAYARVTKKSGGNSFIAYSVVNDGGAPGERTGDGAFNYASSGSIVGTNSSPIANAGPDQNTPRNVTIVLDGSGSTDPDGDLLTYQWALTVPQGSKAHLSDVAIARPSFVPDLPGTYVASLIVNDGHLDSPADNVSITALNSAPKANAGADQYFYENSLVTLDGGASSDLNGDPIYFKWGFVSKPAGSAATLLSTTTSKPKFTADLEGVFEIGLEVSDGFSTSPRDTVTVTAYKQISSLAYRVIDAEYSKILDRIIMVSSGPDRLYVYDPNGKTESNVDLPLPPSSVSVSPDGNYAAVGHNAFISYVDLVNGTLVKTLPVSQDVLDVVLAGNGYVYSFPRRDQWTSIDSVNIATGSETQGTGTIYAGTVAKLHPGGKAMYGANNGLSPSNIEKYDITGGTANILYGSPYWGDFPMCGNLWISEDGARIFTRCGNVFRASNNRSQDMTYNGALGELSLVQHLSHSSAANKVVVIPGNPYFEGKGSDTELQFYDYEFLTLNHKTPLPGFILKGKLYAGHGRFVFFSSNAQKWFAIIQADESSGLLNDFGVVTYGNTRNPANAAPVAQAGLNQLVLLGTQVTLDGTSSSDLDGDPLTYHWNLVSKPDGSSAFLSNPSSPKPFFNADLEGAYQVTLVVNDGREDSDPSNLSITANRSISGLTFRVIDAEYSRKLDSIVMVSSGPDQLHIYDPVTYKDRVVNLPLTPTCVSVSPDGQFAAVGHNAFISYVDLVKGTLVKTLPVTADVLDVVLAGNGYVYAFPRRDQWTNIRCINLSTGAETLGGGQIYAGTLAKLHPSGKAMYGANNGLSPSDIEKYDISGGTAKILYNSPYHGDFPMCGDLWISEDGARIFTRCGNVFRSSGVKSEDMTYNGSLSEVTRIRHLSDSTSAKKIMVIPGDPYANSDTSDLEIRVYSPEFLAFERAIDLPSFPGKDKSFAGHGRFVFFNSSGTKAFVIMQADQTSGMLNDYGVFLAQ